MNDTQREKGSIVMVTQSYERIARARKYAEGSFNESFAMGVFARGLRRLFGRPVQLQFLDRIDSDAYVREKPTQYAVDLDKIIGT
ncbi:MAG: hypothetical protein AAF125_14475, partial [Chloroflexota bacterium]